MAYITTGRHDRLAQCLRVKSRLMLCALLGAGAAMDEIRTAFASNNY